MPPRTPNPGSDTRARSQSESPVGIPFDVQAVMRTVGPPTCARGLAYFESGAVISLALIAERPVPVYSARVRGTARSPYAVTVYAGAGGTQASTARAEGTCTCPMRINCKHVAATMFAVGRGVEGPEDDPWYGETPGPAGSPGGSARSGALPSDPGAGWSASEEERQGADTPGFEALPSRRPDRSPNSGRGAAAPAAWERALRPGLARRTAVATDVPELALLIEPRRRSDGAMSLSMRPVRLGDRGRWVRTGISWRHLSYTYRGLPEAPATLLREILTLHAASSRSYYAPDPTTIDLVTFPGARIWSILAECADAGLPLVSSLDGAPILLAAEPARAVLSISAGGAAAGGADPAGGAAAESVDPASGAVGPGLGPATGPSDWVVRPRVMVGARGISADPVFLGEPVHGVAWLDSAGGGDRAGSADGDSGEPAAGTSPASPGLHLARFTSVLADGAARLLVASEPITIPPRDHDRFVRDYLPALRRELEVSSADGSVDLPEPAPGALVLTIRADGRQRVRLSWQWRYTWAREEILVSIGGSQHLEIRDLLDESALTATVLEALDRHVLLSRRTATGWQLLPDVVLTPSESITFARLLLPRLDHLERVEIDLGDGALALREASGPPIVLVGSAGASAKTPVATDWLDMSITVTVDGEVVFLKDLFAALAAGQQYVILPSGTYFLADHPDLLRLQRLIAESFALADPDAQTVSVSRFNGHLWAELDAMGVLDEQARAWSAAIRKLAAVDDIPRPAPPSGFSAQLRPYQEAGYAWLAFLLEHGLGGVLADDMGLGKTIQALAVIARSRSESPSGAPFLVVAPTSVVPNWAEEAGRFAPGLVVRTVTATSARREQSLAELAAGADIVITSYALFRLEYDSYENLAWTALLLDEAQQIKNYLGKGYRCARSLPVPVKIVITGTPMENNLMELWAMFSLVAPGLFGNPLHFNEQFRHPIERSHDPERLAVLRRRIRPLLLRRTKQEVAADLPPKTEQLVEVDLSSPQRRAYQRFLQRERRKVLGLIGELDRNRFTILRSLTVLRQAAIDVSLVDPDLASVPSAKLDALVEIVSSAAAEGHRVLVFSQFTRFLARAKARLDEAGLGYCYLDGATRNRPSVIAGFRNGDAPAFLISLKAGGVGLNLTEADYCILADPWWNPATEAQAVDRTHRIGQDRPVVVYRLVARDTIEQKVLALSARKAELTAAVMDEGGVGGAGLTAADIRALLK